jgi:ribosomal protein S18 acetylase RimI-like enzyme
MSLHITSLDDTNRRWAHELIAQQWGGMTMVSRGQLYDMRAFPGLVAILEGERVGLLTYRIEGAQCEVMSLDSLREGLGIGRALLREVQDIARSAGCRRLWLITTNDNLHALRFYQRWGFTLAALHVNALAASRALKPSIPLIGIDDIPLRDEIELEMAL